MVCRWKFWRRRPSTGFTTHTCLPTVSLRTKLFQCECGIVSRARVSTQHSCSDLPQVSCPLGSFSNYLPETLSGQLKRRQLALWQITHRLGMGWSHSRGAVLDLVPWDNLNSACRSGSRRAHGHTAPLRSEANLSGAGGEVMRALGIWGGFSSVPGKQELPLNTGKKTLTLILQI